MHDIIIKAANETVSFWVLTAPNRLLTCGKNICLHKSVIGKTVRVIMLLFKTT